MRIVQHTWHWLSSRLSARAIWSDCHHAPARPCMPAVELLGDRILLSGTTAISEVPDEPVKGDGSVRVLIGLLNGEVDLVKAQLQSLSEVARLSSKIEFKIELLNKLSAEFLDINDVLQKAGEVLIKGELLNKHAGMAALKLDYGYKLETELNDLNKLTSKLGREPAALLLPAVQKVREAAVRMFSDLSQYKLDESYKFQDQKVLLHISDVFAKMDDLLLKSAVDVLTGGFYKDSVLGPVFKLEELVLKTTEYLQKVQDPALYKILLPAINDVAAQFKSLLGGNEEVPVPKLSFTGGLSVQGQTDDLISEA